METVGCLIDTPTTVSVLVSWATNFGNKIWVLFLIVKNPLRIGLVAGNTYSSPVVSMFLFAKIPSS